MLRKNSFVSITSIVLLLILGSKVDVNLGNEILSFTLQSFFLVLSARLFGIQNSLIGVAIYISLGVWGLDVFSSAEPGLEALHSASIGYLLGFFPAVLMSSQKTSVFFHFFIAHLVILLSGALGLMLLKELSLKEAMINGVLPFILVALFKSGVASILVRYIKKYFD